MTVESELAGIKEELEKCCGEHEHHHHNPDEGDQEPDPWVDPGPRPPPPPPGSDAPVYDPEVHLLIASDNFETYESLEGMSANNTGPRMVPYPSPQLSGHPVNHETAALISPGRLGGQAYRMKFPGGEGAPSLFFKGGPATLDTDLHMFEFWARVNIGDPNYLGFPSLKWFQMWHRHAAGERAQFNTHDRLPCSEQDGGHGKYWQMIDAGLSNCAGNQPVGPHPKDMNDNAWHRYSQMYRPNTREGSRDGIARMWIEGNKIIDVSAAMIGITPPGGDKTWCEEDDVDHLKAGDGIGHLRWGGAQTTKSPEWTMDVDDFKWWVRRAA